MFAQEVAAVLQGLLRLEGKHGKIWKITCNRWEKHRKCMGK